MYFPHNPAVTLHPSSNPDSDAIVVEEGVICLLNVQANCSAQFCGRSCRGWCSRLLGRFLGWKDRGLLRRCSEIGACNGQGFNRFTIFTPVCNKQGTQIIGIWSWVVVQWESIKTLGGHNAVPPGGWDPVVTTVVFDFRQFGKLVFLAPKFTLSRWIIFLNRSFWNLIFMREGPRRDHRWSGWDGVVTTESFYALPLYKQDYKRVRFYHFRSSLLFQVSCKLRHLRILRPTA